MAKAEQKKRDSDEKQVSYLPSNTTKLNRQNY